MGRKARVVLGGVVYHVLNRGNGRGKLFHKQADYAAFERVLEQAWERVPVDLFSYILMPNHWHLVVRPRRAEDLAGFVRWLSVTHAQRWRAHSHSAGTGHVYQGRFKSFPVQADRHFLVLCRYVERNALRAGLVERAEDWRWGSLWRRARGGVEAGKMLAQWPVDRPGGWVELVNRAMSAKEEEAVRESVKRGRPLGEAGWGAEMTERLGLEHTYRGRGRPKGEVK